MNLRKLKGVKRGVRTKTNNGVRRLVRGGKRRVIRKQGKRQRVNKGRNRRVNTVRRRRGVNRVRNGYNHHGLGEYSFNSKVPARELFRQRGYGKFIRQRGYGTLISQRGYSVYNHPTHQGAGIGYLFRCFIKLAKPLLRKGVQLAKPIAVRSGKALLKEAMHSGKDVVSDIINERNVKSSLKKRSGEMGKRIGRRTLASLMKRL